MESNLKELGQFIKQLVEGNKPINAYDAGTNVNVEGAQLISLPKTHDLYELKDFLPKDPVRIVKNLELFDISSFIAYVNEYKGAFTHIFGDLLDVPASFVAIIDYHGKDVPGWCNHKVELILKHSQEFINWKHITGKMVKQNEFAEFLKDNRMDIIEPVSSSIIELVMKLETTSNLYCASKLPTNDGMVLKFEENIQTHVNGAIITVPNMIVLNIPMFFGMDPVRIKAEFKMRMIDKMLAFGIRLLEIQNMELAALKAISEVIKKETGKKVLI